MSDEREFDYDLAFSRNIGLVQPAEQQELRRSTVAIAGLGGVGGVHLTTLARMGIGAFHIADFDRFELHNLNRQAGATWSTLGCEKASVMSDMALDINPAATVRKFGEGINEANVEEFLTGVDVAIDGLDYFALGARDVFYRAAKKLRIPVVAAGPIGCSAALLVFMPDGMGWHDYFAMDLGATMNDKYLLFALGTAPRALQMPYLDRTYVNLDQKRGPSLAPAVQLCAGVTAAEVLKILLKRGPVFAAPYYQQVDAFRCKYVRGRLRWGNRGPIQRLKYTLFRKLLQRS
jgi:molybdopterin/thiamine biosynthesis adenylyltransferase